jgi:ferrous iron transport protein B
MKVYDRCRTCPFYVETLGVDTTHYDYLVGLAGNPNTGKTTLFNLLTGLRQHVGNWPGKTVVRAEGGFEFRGKRYKLVDLPGTYSLLTASPEEEVARDFILFAQPDAMIVVMDATALERNLNLTFQILEITSQVVCALNLMDEARNRGIELDVRALERELGVPVVPMSATRREGVSALLEKLESVASGNLKGNPPSLPLPPEVEEQVRALTEELFRLFPNLKNPRWIALRLLEGDASLERLFRTGEIINLLGDEGILNPENKPTPALSHSATFYGDRTAP